MSHRFKPLRRSSFVKLALLFVALMLGSSGTLRAQDDALKTWESFDFTKRAIQPAQIKDLDESGLKLLRGIVFGRHGRIFKDPEIKNYLSERNWYKPDAQFQNSMLSDAERQSLDVIRLAEAKLHTQIEPGDLRYWQTRPFNVKQLGEHTGAEWRILRAEVEAIHGRRFDDEPWIQNYFDERYWYKASARYDPKQLSAVERRNLSTIEAAQKRQRKLAISPGDMEHFQNTAITEAMLGGLSLYELRLLRNEVYARHGRQFRTEWLSQYFYSQQWYEPSEETTEPELSPIEKQNVETIVAYENRVKEELSTKAVSRGLLEGLFLEDARKLRYEIYARHGKVFKDKWLNGYFASFPWYKPDPQYKDSTLSAIERRNVAALLAYEKKASSVMDAIEG